MSEHTHTNRGFERVDFTDHNGVACSLQQSSAVALDQEDALERPGTSLVWLGCNDADPQYFIPNGNPSWRPVQMPESYIANTRMHLNAGQVRMLIENLQSWLESGSFAQAEWPDCIGDESSAQ